MTHLFFNCLAASAGSGLTYLRNVVPHLSARTDLRATIAVRSSLQREFGELHNVSWIGVDEHRGTSLRFWHEQAALPRLIRSCGADVLISAGNFALWRSPVPQILLSGNSLYTSGDFYQDLRSRGDYRLWADTRIKGMFAKKSVHWSDRTVAPSRSFAEDLHRWTGAPVTSIHHGFDYETFSQDGTPLSVEVQKKLTSAKDSLRLLFVSHYNYYRNFETLLRAIPRVQERLGKRRVTMFLTCKLRSEENPGSYRAESAAALVQQLGIGEQVVELGAVPYHLLHHLYSACEIYVTPAYAETFAHPLVEAMASGLPVVAADLPVHREVCGDAARYFQRFSSRELAEQILHLAGSPELQKELGERGRLRSRQFSWAKHVDEILGLAASLIHNREQTISHHSATTAPMGVAHADAQNSKREAPVNS
jgi:glycosyltransferase involved in cell wall biosynthesis